MTSRISGSLVSLDLYFGLKRTRAMTGKRQWGWTLAAGTSYLRFGVRVCGVGMDGGCMGYNDHTFFPSLRWHLLILLSSAVSVFHSLYLPCPLVRSLWRKRCPVLGFRENYSLFSLSQSPWLYNQSPWIGQTDNEAHGLLVLVFWPSAVRLLTAREAMRGGACAAQPCRGHLLRDPGVLTSDSSVKRLRKGSFYYPTRAFEKLT